MVAVRSALATDSARLAELSGVLGYPVTSSGLALRLNRLLAQAEDAVFVAETKSGVVGWIHGAEQELLESGRRCEILGLVVDPCCRGQGVGSRLVHALERWAADRGLQQMTVRSNVTRAEAHLFYERLGYLRSKTQHAYRKALKVYP